MIVTIIEEEVVWWDYLMGREE